MYPGKLGGICPGSMTTRVPGRHMQGILLLLHTREVCMRLIVACSTMVGGLYAPHCSLFTMVGGSMRLMVASSLACWEASMRLVAPSLACWEASMRLVVASLSNLGG